MTKEIQLTQNKAALVDDSDFEYLNQYKWCFNGRYAIREIRIEGRKRTVLMHRIIVSVPSGLEIDHINGNGCDNRRNNLRLCTHKQNVRNCKKCAKQTSSKYKGVCWHKINRKWQAYIGVDGKIIYLGYFAIEDDAARAYNIAALKYFDEFAKPNIIEVGT